MTTLKEEIAELVAMDCIKCRKLGEEDWKVDCSVSPCRYQKDIADQLLSLILKHIEEKLTVIGDEEMEKLSGLFRYDKPVYRKMVQVQLQYTISQLKNILTNKEE